MLLQIRPQPVAHRPVHQGADVGVAQLGLGLPLELGLRELYADDGRESLPDIVPGQVGVAVLEELGLSGVVVHHPGEGRPEAL